MELNSGWVAAGSPASASQSATQAHAGTYSWQFTGTGAGNFQGIRNASFWQEPMIRGNFYTLNFWAYAPAAATVSVSMSEFGTSQYNLNVPDKVSAASAWVNHVLTFEALYDEANPIVFFSSGTENTGTWYIDDVTFKQVLNPIIGDVFANNAAALAGGVPINSSYAVTTTYVTQRCYYA